MANPIIAGNNVDVIASVKSCGVMVFKESPKPMFLLMRHKNRWDFPNGHLEPGETEIECALRELVEETDIQADQIELDPQFRFSMAYTVYLKRFNFEPREKTLVMFLGRLNSEVSIKPSEHVGYEWSEWDPPHVIQTRTIDPVLHAIEMFWKSHPDRRSDEQA